MGQPGGVHTPSPCTESIGVRREPPELKHLSRARKRHQHEIPSVVASERGRGQTGGRNPSGVWTAFRTGMVNRRAWEGPPKSVRVT